MFATDPETGVDVRCRFDFLPKDRRVAVDLKTGRKGQAKSHKFATAVTDYGYHISWAHYMLTAELAEEPVHEMVFLVVETEPPHHVATYVLDRDFKEIGQARALQARRRFARALETGEWPGLPPQIQTIRPPAYEIYRHIDQMENPE
jgi:hypothetical protein